MGDRARAKPRPGSRARTGSGAPSPGVTGDGRRPARGRRGGRRRRRLRARTGRTRGQDRRRHECRNERTIHGQTSIPRPTYPARSRAAIAAQPLFLCESDSAGRPRHGDVGPPRSCRSGLPAPLLQFAVRGYGVDQRRVRAALGFRVHDPPRCRAAGRVVSTHRGRQFRRSPMCCPTRSALAMIVRVGLTAPIDGKKLESTT